MTYIGNAFSGPERSQNAKRMGWQEAVSFLNRLSPEEYWPARLPSEDDIKITEICEIYRQLSADERINFEKMLTQKRLLYSGRIFYAHGDAWSTKEGGGLVDIWHCCVDDWLDNSIY